MFPIGGAGFSPAPSININLNPAGASGVAPLAGLGGGLPGGISDGFSPSSELLGGSPGFGLSPFGPSGLNNFAAQLAGSSMPDFTGFLDTPTPGLGSFGGDALPLSILSEGSGLLDGGGLPPLGDGSLTSQALMLQAAASDANQASLIGAQSGAFGSLSGAQGMALAGGISPLMSGLSANFL